MDRRALARTLMGGLAACIVLAGCAVSDPTRYYALGRAPATGNAAPRPAASPPPARAAGSGNLTIGIGPIIVPGYLDRINIVTRTSSDQVDLSPFHRWAEPLVDGIARALSEEIAAGVPTERVIAFPWRGVVARSIDYQVVVNVLRFDGPSGGDLTFDARWRILAGDGKELLLRRTTLTEPTGGPGYDPMIAAMDRALATFGRQIVTEIRAIAR
jgi:uncharacterized lipoprotein YmbA